MRHSELSEGISVLDDNGNVVATSKVAARHVQYVDHFLPDEDLRFVILFF